MSTVTFHLPDSAIHLDARELHGRERLGEAGRFELTAFSVEPVAAASVVGLPCSLVIAGGKSGRVIRGMVTRFTAVATAQTNRGRRYRLEIRSWLARLEHRRLTRVFQHLTAPGLIKKVLLDAGWPAGSIQIRVQQGHASLPYRVQYAETDAGFIRRICEEEGLYFRFASSDDGEVFVLEDTSTATHPTLPGPLLTVDEAGLSLDVLAAYHFTSSRRRRVGKVTLRDYDPLRPSLPLEGVQSSGTGVEKKTEVYAAPGRFLNEAEGKTRAQLHLEALRVDGSTITFETTALALAPGEAVDLEAGPDQAISPQPEGPQFVVGLTHAWKGGEQGYTLTVEAIARAIPYRLKLTTPRPRIAGVQTAVVTGAPGQEIHPDKEGRIFVHFPWDRWGPSDDKSSLPVRVAQPNSPDSMVIPRVGWEVITAFEDGDPDRPFILGRSYNAKHPPPFPLPANKTVTSVKSHSSPGGGGHNSIHFDDAAGRQHLAVHASFGKTTRVANNMMTQVAKVEKQSVKGSQSYTIGSNDDISITQAHIVDVGSQTATVGATQSLYVKGNYSIDVGSESVLVGGALLEKVGNPVTGLTNLAVAAALAGAGALGSKLGPIGSKVAAVGTGLVGVGWGAYQAATAPGAGPNAGRDAGIRGLLGAAAGHVTGGDALFATISSTGLKLPWEKTPEGAGGAADGGGAGGAQSDSAAAKGPGPGHRNNVVKGAMAEVIGSSHAVVTPGSVRWQTTGASLVGVGASHTTKAVAVGAKFLGASMETLGSFHVDAGTDVGREAKRSVTTSIGGALKSNSGGQHSISAGSSVTIKVGGSMTMNGSVVVFIVGDAVVASSPGGVLIKAPTITITGASKQAGKATHS